MFLNCCVALRITIDSNCTFFRIFIEFVFYVVVNQIENQFFHVYTIFLLECEDTFVIEQESQRTSCSQVSAELVEYRTYIGNGTCCIVCQCINKYSNSVRTVSFVCHSFVFALVFTHCVLDCAFDIILRHVFALTSCDN